MDTLVQSTKGKLKPFIGFSIIALSVLSLFILDGILVWLYEREIIQATAANIVIACYALSLFLTLFHFLSLSCVYTLDGVKLTFSRVYIKKPRLAEQIMLREIVFFGLPEDARHHAYSHTQRFTARRGSIETRAIIYRRGGKTQRILFSPNEEITQALQGAVKNKKAQ